MKNKYLAIILGFQILISVLTIIFFNGTGDSGDSVMHYLFARFAYNHPELFFDHWAKPLYVLLASPFALFGFIGIKVFNAAIAVLNTLYTYKTIQRLNIANPSIGAMFLVFSPLVFVLTFSGLTEPLFAFFLILGVYFMAAKKPLVSVIIISFLPFIRSEGLIFLGVFAFYLMLKRNWKPIPLLASGHAVYSIAGYFIHKDILWVFNKIPYATLSSTYGKGKLMHFVDQMTYVVGIPVYVLFGIGVFAIIWYLVKRKINLETIILVYAGFFAFFIAHTLFWYFGIFNSMGLKRVLIGVAPLSSIIALMGFNFVTHLLKQKRKLRIIVQYLLIVYVIVFPVSLNPASIHWRQDLCLSKDQIMADSTVAFLKQNGYLNRRFITAAPYLSEALDIDHFNKNKRLELNAGFKHKLNTGDIIIWENMFAAYGNGISKESLDQNRKFINLYDTALSDKGREYRFAVYEFR